MSIPQQSPAARWTIGRLLDVSATYLTQREVDEARLCAEVLLSHAIGCRRIDLYARFEDGLDEAVLDRFRGWVKRAAAREPIAYIVQEKEFFSLPFHVTREVLIPRPETELLVSCVLDHCGRSGWSQPRLLDLGTGSGCIAITLLVQLPGARAVATDVSAAALKVAGSNAQRHGVRDRLVLVEADRLSLPGDAVPSGGFDVLVSNPPYVAADALAGLDATVRDYEPQVALSDGGDGLSFYRSIAAFSPGLLASQGVVFVEVGDGQASSAVEVIESGQALVHRDTWKDRVVGQERVVMFARASGSGQPAPLQKG